MRPIDPPEPLEPELPVAPARRRAQRTPRAVAITDAFSPAWAELVERLAEPIRLGGYQGERHEIFLALAGALLGRRVPAEQVPAIVHAVAARVGADAGHHSRSAADTVRRWAGGHVVKGLQALPPALADVVAVATDHARLRIAAQAAELPAQAAPVAEVTIELENAFRRAPDGLSVIKAQCGLGKTRAARIVAEERANKPHATPGAHVRPPLGSKTAIAVPTNELAGQVAADLRARGVAVLRLFGVLSVKDPSGQPVCAFHEAARALASGGQSIPWEFCEGRKKNPCPHRETCPARDGFEGPEGARVAVAPHELVAELDGFAGSTGLVVLDEPPSLLETEVLEISALELAQTFLPRFEARYAAAMAPALAAVVLWARERGVLDEPGPIGRAFALGVDEVLLERAFEQTGAVTAEDAVKVAFDRGAEREGAVEEGRVPAPPVLLPEMAIARGLPAYASQLATASRVLRALYAAVTLPSSSRIEIRGSGQTARRVLVVTWPREPLGRVLRREGSVVVAGADADVHLPVLERVVGYRPTLSTFAAADGAPVRRTLLRWRATRKAWLADGLNVVAIARALRVVVGWVLEHPYAKLAIATFKAVAERIIAELAALSDPARVGDVGPLASVLRDLPVLPEVGHYGALRGLDRWKDFDAIVTLGDPWPALGTVQHEADFLGLDWETRAEALCRAELEQAHGRLRTVHRRESARALHVGHVLPGGWGLDVEVREDLGGRPAQTSDVTPDELRAAVAMVGGVSAAARAWGCHRQNVQEALKGKRGLPEVVADRVRELLLHAPQGPPEGAPRLRAPLFAANCTDALGGAPKTPCIRSTI